MPKTTIDDALGLVQTPGTGFSVSSSLTVTGAASVAAASGLTCNSFLAGFIPNAAPQTLSAAGAVNVTAYMTYLNTTSGAMAITLAAGTAVGQLKKVMMVVDGGDATLTIADPVSASLDVVVFSNIGDTLDLIWSGTAWRILGAYNVAAGNVSTPVVS
jgi:hypothetical protein